MRIFGEKGTQGLTNRQTDGQFRAKDSVVSEQILNLITKFPCLSFDYHLSLVIFLQGWTKTNAFHVCITSYKLVIQDHQAFRRKKWKYLVLDEAQNIKNFKSQR